MLASRVSLTHVQDPRLYLLPPYKANKVDSSPSSSPEVSEPLPIMTP